MRKTTILWIVALLAVLAMPTASASEYYLVLDNSSAKCCTAPDNCTTVDVWLNATEQLYAGFFNISFDAGCAKVPSFTYNNTCFSNGGAIAINVPGFFTVGFDHDDISGNPALSPCTPSHVHLGNFTICCNTTTPPCQTNLEFDDGTGTWNLGGATPFTVNNGTFTCNKSCVPAIEIEKWVKDSTGNWVDSISVSNGDTVDFRINVTNTGTCCNLSDIVINDTLPAGLGGGFNQWTFAELNKSETKTVTFSATVTQVGTHENCANVTANCTTEGVKVSDDDCATVTTTMLKITKEVWDEVAWVKVIPDAKIGDKYTFRCVVENIDQNNLLTGLSVNDWMSQSLKYDYNAWLTLPDLTTTPINPPDHYDPVANTFGWTINNWVGSPPFNLLPSQKFVIEYDVTVVTYGNDTNSQSVCGWCPALGMGFNANDKAYINTPKPDLNVTKIEVNMDLKYAKNYAFVHNCNNINATIIEGDGVAFTDTFNVSFFVNWVEIGKVQVNGMAANDVKDITFPCNWTPTSPGDYTIKVKVDYDHDIPESDEGNNTRTMVQSVVYNGYKGNGHQDGRNITNYDTYEGTVNMSYTHGNSYYLSGKNTDWANVSGVYNATFTPDDLDLPGNPLIIKDARLYVYYTWDKTPKSEGGITNATDGYYVNLEFNGVNDTLLPPVVHYMDQKGFGGSNYPNGMLAYDVKTALNTTADNTANITYTFLHGYKELSMVGMVLMVVYENDTEPERIIIINEGYDFLYASGSYGVTPEEATTHASFGEVPKCLIDEATLVTIAPSGNKGGDKNRLYFNDGEWHGIWDGYPSTTHPDAGKYKCGDPNLGMNETDVLAYLTNPTDNKASFQDRGDYMAASNAILVLEKGGHKCISVDPEYTVVMPQDQFWVDITFDAYEYDIYALEYKLKYNTSVLYAEAQVEGDFLSSVGPTNVVHHVIDHTNGVLEFGVTLVGNDSSSVCRNGGSGTVARIHFHATGSPGQVTDLDLYDVLVLDCSKVVNAEVKVYNGEVEIFENSPPDAVGTTKHRYNNAAEKYTCYADLCACQSSDPDEGLTEIGDEIIYTMWHFGDGSSGTSEGTFDENCQKLHMYTSWNWIGGEGGYYTPFMAGLTLTDDGDPQLSSTDWFDVMVYMGGDANGDGKVNVIDAAYVGKHWRETTSMPEVECCYYWTVEQADKADLNNDLAVNLLDMAIVGANWGHTAWA